ncbi:MAG: serine/threonine-protein kinase [Bryobacteraceae bacterium]|nr:serine/threonine-protein kinase [Bryobacteraceae bacterium]
MGTVYRAMDTVLQRTVAVKVLRADLVANAEQKARFLQEAKAASALQHPNIVGIYHVGVADGEDYMVMEYVAGETLQQRIGHDVGVQDVLRWGIQLADALDAAHRAGIVHRDLKPANVMIGERGEAKILDFGVAKLLESAKSLGARAGGETATISPVALTHRGMVVGSPSYMAPEQAAAKEVDGRTDIFALGVVLYQAMTGVLPFRGESAAAVLASVLRDEPVPLTELVPEAPVDLERTIARCLRKEPSRRYQTMVDVRNALEEIRDDLAAGRTLTRLSAVQPGMMAPPATPLPAAPPRGRPWLGVAATALALLAGGAGTWWWLKRAPAVRDLTLVRLTSEPTYDTTPAISPDGKWMAYASDRGGGDNLDIWLRQIGPEGATSTVRLTNHPADEREPSFSPDGSRLVFRSEREGGGIYTIPTLGGDERLVAPRGRRPVFSPDGNRVAYWAGRIGQASTRAGWSRIFVTDLTGGNPQAVVPSFLTALYPIFTPDGQHLLFVGGNDGTANSTTANWWVAPLAGGEPIDTGFQASVVRGGYDHLLKSPVAFRGDRVLFSHTTEETSDMREVEISPRTWKAEGAAHRLTFGTTREDFPSVSQDGKLVFASNLTNIDVYSLNLQPNAAKVEGNLQRVTSSPAYESVRDVSADGKRLVMLARHGGHGEVWGKDLVTGVEKQLTNTAANKRQPVITPDGQWVAFAEDGTGANAIYVVPFAGGNPRRVCERCGTQSGWAPDGRHLLYTNYSKPHNPIWVLDVETGQQKEVLKHGKHNLFPRSFSPDSRWISFGIDRGNDGVLLALAPYRPGNPAPESEWILLTDGTAQESYPRWSPDGSLIYFTSDREGPIGIFALRLDPVTKRPQGPAFSVYRFQKPSLRMNPRAMWISVARDKIVFSLEETSGNIWMLQP